MDALMALCDASKSPSSSNCARHDGAIVGNTPSSLWQFGCYSTQTYKHVNSGEGGLLISDDADGMREPSCCQAATCCLTATVRPHHPGRSPDQI
jgi:dTDP-4-amino-4,6-dideoxygalactose transaminase